MFLTCVNNRVHVTLSRRNLRDLVGLLDAPDLARRCLARRDQNGVCLVVEVENDADHYEGREAGPGWKLGEMAEPHEANHP
jgi:hypothetical protein